MSKNLICTDARILSTETEQNQNRIYWVGQSWHREYAEIEGIEIKALNDIYPKRLENALKRITGSHNPILYSGSENVWEKLCQKDDIDLA